MVMYLRKSIKYDKNIQIIHPGEFFASGDDLMIGTILGSCIAVCLIDEEEGLGGMNHFMLPGKIREKDIMADKTARYGITAMNSLFAEMIRLGAIMSRLSAKIFGGGHVLNTGNITAIPEDNIRLARVMLEMEDIPIVASDVGGEYTRKIMLEVKSGSVFQKKTTRADVINDINERDMKYVRSSLNE
jgi:chemotaxis protein CheD